MKQQAFQFGEVRDEQNNIIRAGTWGRTMPFVNAENNGILDYIINNFHVHQAAINALGADIDENGNPVLSKLVADAMNAIKNEAIAARDSASGYASSALGYRDRAILAETNCKNYADSAEASALAAEASRQEASEIAKAKGMIYFDDEGYLCVFR